MVFSKGGSYCAIAPLISDWIWPANIRPRVGGGNGSGSSRTYSRFPRLRSK
ncbi:hypothetical protein OKW46_006980 [Paraburkholderia sp. WSM4179]|nr:hypothetical protein [Paraburkholderia sp. WSM4179]